MSNNPAQVSPLTPKTQSENNKESKNPSVVITVRIDEELNSSLENIKRDIGISKANLIRNYLEFSHCLIKQKTSLKSLDDQDFIIIMRSFFQEIIEKAEETEQISLGDKLARFINSIALIKNKGDDLIFKLDLCNSLGFFRKYIDDQNYVLISKKFGPKKFVEAFTWQLFNKKEFNSRYTEEELKGSKSLTQQYNKEIHPV
ncbi:MAG: hypothetical protein ACFE8B_08070, partial [Candidatus Hermodarchaeota archaeon]